MKTIKYTGYISMILVLFFFGSCEKTKERVESKDPVIVLVSPKTAREGAIISIIGRNFSTLREENVVKFNGLEAIVLEASEGELKVIVPDSGSDGKLTLTVRGQALEGPTFSYEIPGIEYLVQTLAGGSAAGFTDGTGTGAQFSTPEGVDIHPNGNIVVTDRTNNAIRLITQAGVVTTLSGDGTKGLINGPVTTAKFNFPWKSAVDTQGNIYVAERDNDCIRKITPAGIVSTLAGSTRGYAEGKGTDAKFNQPLDVAVDPAGNVYVTDNNNHRIRKITADGTVSTLAGSTVGYADGTGPDAKFSNPSGLEVDVAGNVYVADRNNHRIRKITPAGVVTTVAGKGTAGRVNGSAADATFNQPYGIAVGTDGSLIVGDLANNLVRKIDAQGQVTTVAGTSSGYSDGAGGSARFNQPTDVAISSDGTIYVADLGNNRIRKITVL
jgi:sugar lactone lactonase YvrE